MIMLKITYAILPFRVLKYRYCQLFIKNGRDLFKIFVVLATTFQQFVFPYILRNVVLKITLHGKY